MNNKIIESIVRKELIREATEWDNVLTKIKTGLNSAKKEFKNFLDDVLSGNSNLSSKDVIKSLKTSASGRALMSDEAFMTRVNEISQNIGVDSSDLIRVMQKESKLNPRAINPTTGASGLIQFMPRTAAGLGTSVDEIRRMPAIEQLDYVEKFFQPFKGRLHSYEDLYLATFFPAAVGRPDSTIIQSKKLSANIISKQNGVIARAAGKIPGEPLTIGDFKRYANAA